MDIQYETINQDLEIMESQKTSQPKDTPSAQSLEQRLNNTLVSRRTMLTGMLAGATGVMLAKPLNATPAVESILVSTEAADYDMEYSIQVEAAVDDFIDETFEDYLNDFSNPDEREFHKRYRDEAYNLMKNVYKYNYGEDDLVGYKAVPFKKFIAFVVSNRHKEEEDIGGMKDRKRPIAYMAAARALDALIADNASSKTLGYKFTPDEWDVTLQALKQTNTGDDFYGMRSARLFDKKYGGDVSYVHFNPGVLDLERLAREGTAQEKYIINKWREFNGESSELVKKEDEQDKTKDPKKTHKIFNPKYDFSKYLVFKD